MRWTTWSCCRTSQAVRFGALEVLPGESGVNLELLAERLGVVERIAKGELHGACVLVAPVQALMQPVPTPGRLARNTRSRSRKPRSSRPAGCSTGSTARGTAGRTRSRRPATSRSAAGSSTSIPPPGLSPCPTGETAPIGPVRIDYFGDEIDTIRRIDDDRLGSGEKLRSVRLVGGSAAQLQADPEAVNLLDLLPQAERASARVEHVDAGTRAEARSAELIVVLHEIMELTEQARGYYERLTHAGNITSPNAVFHRLTQRPHVEVNQYGTADDDALLVRLPLAPLPSFSTDAQQAVEELGELARDDVQRVVVLCRQPAERERLNELLEEFVPEAKGRVGVEVAGLHRGFVWEDGRDGETKGRRDAELGAKDGGASSPTSSLRPSAPSSLHLIPHHELFHRYETSRRVRRLTAGTGGAGGRASDAFLDLNVGDYVVHVDHGIAQFTGLKTMRRDDKAGEYLTLTFAQGALLHVPATQIELIQKYVGGFEGKPPLSVLGGKRWQKQKEQTTRGGEGHGR